MSDTLAQTQSPDRNFTLRRSTVADVDDIFRLIMDLAVYEKLSHEVVSSPAILRDALFCEHPRVYCDVVEVPVEGSDKPRVCGMALWFYSYSTFTGKHGIYLEDLFVEPDYRGRGYGFDLLKNLAARCVDEGLTRLEWSVLNWNKPAIDFYLNRGAIMMDEWTRARVHGDNLIKLSGR